MENTDTIAQILGDLARLNGKGNLNAFNKKLVEVLSLLNQRIENLETNSHCGNNLTDLAVFEDIWIPEGSETPQRRRFFVEVGDMPKEQIEEQLRQIMAEKVQRMEEAAKSEAVTPEAAIAAILGETTQETPSAQELLETQNDAVIQSKPKARTKKK